MINQRDEFLNWRSEQVMECAWARLGKQIDLAETMDDVLTPHVKYLSTVVAEAMLEQRSMEILTQLSGFYYRILEYRLHNSSFLFYGLVFFCESQESSMQNPQVSIKS